MRPYLEKKKITQKTAGVAQGVLPEFKSQYHKRKEKNHVLSYLNHDCLGSLLEQPNSWVSQ
jgi:hypothetical protein